MREGRGATRLPRFDRVLLVALLGVWGVVFTLHVREVVRTGLALSPIFAVADPSGGAPRVGGLRLETGGRSTPFAPGDRLLRAGDVDLDGVGSLGFEAVVHEQAGSGLRTRVDYERAGERRQAILRLEPEPLPWLRIPTVLVLVAACTLVLVKGRGTRGARLFFAAFLSCAIYQSPFPGGSYAQTVASAVVGSVFGALVVVLVMRWATFFPDEVRDRHRVSTRWSWLAGVLYLGFQVSRALGAPLPPELLPRLALAAHAGFLLATLAIVVHNFRRADPIGRRRAKWALYGSSVALAPLIILQLAAVTVPSPVHPEWLALGSIATAIAPISVLIAISRYNLYDIDLLIRTTASYSLLLVVLLASALAIAPLVAGAASAALGVQPGAARLILALALAGVAIPLYSRLRPRIDRVFFPERVALERGVEQLLRDLSASDGPGEVLALVGERVAELLRPETCVCWVKTGTTYGPVVVRGPTVRHEFPAEGRLALALELHERPLNLDAGGLIREAPDLGDADAQLLRRLRARVLVPLRQGRKLSAFFAIGPKTSGDIYTATDLALLATVAEKASAELLRIQRAAIIRGQRLRADQLRGLRAAAEDANLTKSRFFAAASHDLRQPLHALGLFVETLEERAHDADDRSLVAGIRTSTNRLSGMFNALLDLSRLDAGRVVPHPTDLELDPLLARACAEAAPEARERGLRLRRAPTRARVHSDPHLLARLVGWLVENAVRHTERGGVLIGCRRRGGAVRIEIWDTGPGIPDARRTEIFQEFATLDEDARPRGLGLGLTLVERTAELLAHRIELDSRPGRGTVFSVTVPRAEPRTGPSAPAAPSTASGLEGRRVLVIDDDPAILEGMSGRLERWGCQPLSAASADAAIALLSAGAPTPDAILADYRLAEGRTGLEAIERLRAHIEAPVPAVVITGETAPETLEAIRTAGFQRLSKPVSPARLRAVLDQLLRDL